MQTRWQGMDCRRAAAIHPYLKKKKGLVTTQYLSTFKAHAHIHPSQLHLIAHPQ